MDYWKGQMDWPLDKGWKCETCGVNEGLEWGLVHAQCRCNKCHTEYYMRDENDKIVTTPICTLKREYKEPAKRLWEKYHIPIDETNDAQWDEFVSLSTKFHENILRMS
jgi:trehalose-6-phosphate synthase